VTVATCIMVSGTGTILEAICAAAVRVDLVVADRPCPGLEVASARGIDAVLVDRAVHGGFAPSFDRAGYTTEIEAALVARDVDLVCMAGFGTVLAETFFQRFAGRVLNTHPSLLPAFPGWHAVSDALREGATVTGCTVHVATVAVDDGPILRQARVDVLPSDDEASLHERIKQVERRLYPATIALVRDALDRGAPATSVAETAEVVL
jgi:phosphoribosylglycinamide formyltransferase-1